MTHRSAGLVLSALAIGGMLWRVTMAGSERDRRLLAQWASSCAQRVLPMFEVQHPTDARPRQALETARAWVRGEVSVDQAREAAPGRRTAPPGQRRTQQRAPPPALRGKQSPPLTWPATPVMPRTMH